MDAGYKDEYGYIYVVARDDDVINVSGHRLSTAAMEEVVLSHPDVVDAAVVGVPESAKGEIPVCLYVMKSSIQYSNIYFNSKSQIFKCKCSINKFFFTDSEKSEYDINTELQKLVRDMIGPIAACHLTASIKALPRTRSGKIARKSIAELARNKLKASNWKWFLIMVF